MLHLILSLIFKQGRCFYMEKERKEEGREEKKEGRGVRVKAGEVFDFLSENPVIPGCTVSGELFGENGYSLISFSLASGTSISAESYDYPKLLYLLKGEIEVFKTDKSRWSLSPGEAFLIREYAPYGVRAGSDSVYLEFNFRKESAMNAVVKAGEVFKLKNLLPYQDGKIVNLDLLDEERMKFVLMSFDEGTGLSEHSAPGEALVFALEGRAVIGYEGREQEICEGESFHFAKNGRHFVKAKGRFKMALLLSLG